MFAYRTRCTRPELSVCSLARQYLVWQYKMPLMLLNSTRMESVCASCESLSASAHMKALKTRVMGSIIGRSILARPRVLPTYQQPSNYPYTTDAIALATLRPSLACDHWGRSVSLRAELHSMFIVRFTRIHVRPPVPVGGSYRCDTSRGRANTVGRLRIGRALDSQYGTIYTRSNPSEKLPGGPDGCEESAPDPVENHH